MQQYDICVYEFGSVHRSYANMFIHTPFTYKVIPFNMTIENYVSLPEKTYMMLTHLVTYHKYHKCRAALKVDEDATACLNNFDLSNVNLMNVYAGVYVSKAFLGYQKGDKLWTEQLSTIAKNPVFRRPYHQGAAYVVGYNVAKYISREPFRAHFNTGWEDANVGLHSTHHKNRTMIAVKHYVMNPEYGPCVQDAQVAVYHKCNRPVVCE